jgi:16S rRNA (uracil1498-N3)-methyltransferase
MHRMFWEGVLPAEGHSVPLQDHEAAHALRAKRIRAGEAVELLDGAGGVASAICESAAAGSRTGPTLRISAVHHQPPPAPRIEVWAATPKGSRVDEMIEGLSEVGAAAWVPLRAARSVVEPRPTKLDRLQRLAIESAKQCGRAWLLTIGREQSFADALMVPAGTALILADASGSPPSVLPTAASIPTFRLLIGPEGGWTEDELTRARAAGAHLLRAGPHAMRIETAAVAAAAVLMTHFAPSSP